MLSLSRFLPSIAGLVFLALVATAAPSQDPLRFIPEKADFVLKVENPRQLIEAFTRLDAFKEAQQLDPVRQVLDSAAARRIFEFIAYYERDLGAKWPELIDKLAGGGIALGAEVINGTGDPILVAMQGTDEATMSKFVEKASYVIEQELGRAESRDKLTKEKYRDFEMLHLGEGFHACRIGAALLLANKTEALRKGVDQHVANISGSAGKPSKNMSNSEGPAKAKKLLPPDPALWMWYKLDYLKNRPGAKEVLTTPRNDSVLTFAFAGYLDITRRAEFTAVGLYAKPEGFSLTIRMPAGRAGMAEDVELHLPRDPKVSGTLPLLEPKGVIFSHSFYLDLAVFWGKRDKIMNAANAKSVEDSVKQAGRFLPGTSLEKLLMQSGVHHRFVAAVQEKTGYSVEPQVRLPAFGAVTTMRDPSFGKSLEVLVRGGAALATTQVRLRPFDEKYGDAAVFGYRFIEEDKFPADEQNIRFNFTPTFAIVNDQFVAASSLDLCKELIDIVQKEDRTKLITQNMQSRLYAKGGGSFLNSSPEALLAQTILSQAVNEAEAKKQVDRLLTFARKLGSLSFETNYTDTDFRFDINWKIDK